MKKQLDEMEKSIMLKSVLCAWIALETGLAVFTFVYSVGMQTFNLISIIPLVMAIMSLAVFLEALYSSRVPFDYIGSS